MFTFQCLLERIIYMISNTFLTLIKAIQEILVPALDLEGDPIL